MKNFKRVRFALVGVGVVSVAACGGGGEKVLTPEQQQLAQDVKSRQANFQDLGAAFKAINDELKAGRANSTTVEYSIKSVAQYANGIDTWFPDGSGPELGVKMEAKAEIWEQPEAFEAEVEAFRAAVDGLVAASGSPEAIPAAFGNTGKTCKSCHDKFRLED